MQESHSEKKLGRGLSALLGESKAKKDLPISNQDLKKSVRKIGGLESYLNKA